VTRNNCGGIRQDVGAEYNAVSLGMHCYITLFLKQCLNSRDLIEWKRPVSVEVYINGFFPTVFYTAGNMDGVSTVVPVRPQPSEEVIEALSVWPVVA